ncbi:aldo/keto reductase [soil metagenome]
MQYRKFGRTGWQVSDIGYGMWGMGGWTGSDDEESLNSLQLAADLGCNFFDTAFVYGSGHSENLLGQLVRANPDKKLYTATKIPPKNMAYPTLPEYTLDECYPPEHIEEFLHKSLKNASLENFDLLQIHTWNDDWTDDDGWSDMLDSLKSQGLIKACGISINRWEPWNGVKAVRSGKIDSVQVVYNVFDQNPEDDLFPACEEMDVAVIARVPFDEGSLTGTMTLDTTFPDGDFRNGYFAADKIGPIIEHVEALKLIIPADSTMPETVLRYILSHRAVSTIIPGMRKANHVESNIRASDLGPLNAELLTRLHDHRWVRKPAPSSI